jgi:hypothetical protein
MVKNRLLPYHLVSRCLLFYYKWRMSFKCDRFIGSDPPPAFISLFYPDKTTIFIVIGISDSNFLVLIYVFLSFSFLLKFYLFSI